ncbi:MAG TPA: hypothetical protein VFH66_11015 [Mycobacteriales bacterium]|nr:hypothetical protein [Mycobacteriales bacterium]
MPHRAGALAAALTIALLVAGCGGNSKGAAPAQAPLHTFSPTPCATPNTPKQPHWPPAVPADMPKPSNATITDSTTTSDGVHITKFTTPSSLRDAVLFIVGKFPKAGYVLGRGDAEVTEADAPFVHGNTRGLVRLLATEPCSTLWLLATVNTNNSSTGGGTPLLPSRSPSGSPSPLPFG